jgi:hypothetical protein
MTQRTESSTGECNNKPQMSDSSPKRINLLDIPTLIAERLYAKPVAKNQVWKNWLDPVFFSLFQVFTLFSQQA